MEFWILIALVVAIGLFAVISKQSTDKKLEESDQKYAPRGELDERIKSLDTDFNILKRIVDTLKSETDRFNAAQEKISRLESELNTVVSQDDLKSLYERIKREMPSALAPSTAPDNALIVKNIKTIGGAIRAAQEDLLRLQKSVDELRSAELAHDERIQQHVAALNQLHNHLNVMQNNCNVLVNRFNDHQQRLSELEKHLEPQSTTSEAQPMTPEAQPTTSEAQPTTPEAQQETIKPKITVEIKQPGTTKSEPTVETPKELTIGSFNIKRTHEIFLINDLDEVIKRLKEAADLSSIVDFINGAEFDKKKVFLDIINTYKQNLNRLITKVERGKFDEDILSQECTEAFMGVLKNYFLKTLMTAIYRGRKETPDFYVGLLNRINKYLADCRVYTIPVEPGKVMKSGDIEVMEIIPKETDNPAENKIIEEVERLPYNIDYINDDDDIVTMTFDGRMVVYKLIGAKK